jgi:heme exporter protein D
MSHSGYILTAWGVSSAAIVAYCVRVLQRGRSLSRLVPRERRRWMTAERAETQRAKR